MTLNCYEITNTSIPFVSNAQELDSYIIQYTEVQSQQMAFTQSPSLSNNPKIPTYYLIFAEMLNVMKCKMS